MNSLIDEISQRGFEDDVLQFFTIRFVSIGFGYILYSQQDDSLIIIMIECGCAVT
jgi:hypothetical protein